MHHPSKTDREYRAVPCWMQRSRTTSTPSSGRVSVGSTRSRSSMTFVATPRDDSSCRSSFSSTRTRDSRTPTVGVLLTPVFFGLWRERKRDRRCRGDLELRTAVRAGHDLALHRVGADGRVGITFGTLGHGFLPACCGGKVSG